MYVTYYEKYVIFWIFKIKSLNRKFLASFIILAS